MSANSSDSEHSLTDWTLVDEDGKIQSTDSDSDFVTLETENGAAEYRKHSKGEEDDDIENLAEHSNTLALEQSTDVKISSVEVVPKVTHAGDGEETVVKQPIKYFEIPAEETATVGYVEGKTVGEETPEENVEVLTMEEEEEAAKVVTDREIVTDQTEEREIEELTETMITGNDEVESNMQSEVDGHHDETLKGAVATTFKIPLTLIPKHASDDSSSTDSDFVRIDPSSFPDDLESLGCQATGQMTSSCTSCTTVSPTSSLSNFSFLPLAVEGGDDPCDRPDSPDTLNGYESDSDLSVIEDYDSQSALDELTPGAIKPAVRRYRHYRDDGLNNKLNWVLILVVTAGIALGIGHFIGSSNEYHHKKKIQEGQIQRLKSLQNELLSCLEKDEEWDVEPNSVKLQGKSDYEQEDQSVCSVGNQDAMSSVDQCDQFSPEEELSEQLAERESGPENSDHQDRSSDQDTVEDHADVTFKPSESVDTDTEEEPVTTDRLVSSPSKDETSSEKLDQLDHLDVTLTSDESLRGDINAEEIPVTDSLVPGESPQPSGESENVHGATEFCSNTDEFSEADLDVGDEAQETPELFVSDHVDDLVSVETEQDSTTVLEDDSGSVESTTHEQENSDISSEDIPADATEDTVEDLDKTEEESEVNISLVISCQERIQELSEELSFAQGRAEMWKRLFVNDRDKSKSEGCSDDPALSFFTCVNMFVPAVNISEAMKSLQHTPLANFSETVSKLYSDGGDALSNLTETIKDQWGKVNDFVQSEQFQTYVSASKEAVATLNDLLKANLNKVKNLTKSEEFADFTKKTKSAWSRVSESLSSKWQELKTYTTSEDFKSKVTKVGESIQKTWQSVQNYSNKILHGEDTSSTLESVTDSIKRTMDSTWQGVKETVGQVLQKGKKRQRYHEQMPEKESKSKKERRHARSFIKLPGEERLSFEDKIYDKETGDYRYKKSKNVWMKKLKKAHEEAPSVVNGEYRAGRVKNRKFLKKIRLPGEERDTDSLFGFWSNEETKHDFEDQTSKKSQSQEEVVKEHRQGREEGCRNQKCTENGKKGKKERIMKDENIRSWETFEDDYDIQCHGNKQCINKQIEDARKLYVELLHYRQWLKDRHYKKDMKELEEFLSELEQFLDDPHPDDKDLEELQEDFEEVLEDMEKRAKKHNRKQQKAREQQEKELENIRQKPDKELKKESIEEEEEVKDEKRQGFGHKKKGEVKGRARTKRREFHQETVVKPALNDPSFERATQGKTQEKHPDSTGENMDADWFFKRAEDREEQRWHLPKWQDDADPFDNWFFHRAQGRSDERTGITMWDMYNWFLERYEHRAEWRTYQMDDQSNWFLRRP